MDIIERISLSEIIAAIKKIIATRARIICTVFISINH